MHSEKVFIRQARTTPSSAASNCLQIIRRRRRRNLIKIHRPQQLHDPPHYFCFSLSSETCSSKQYWTSSPSPHMSVLLNIYPSMASKIKSQSRQNRRKISSAIVHLDDTIHRAQKIIWSRGYWNLPSQETKVLNITVIMQLWFLSC